MTIPITKPLFGREELEAVQKPLESGWVVQGPYVKQFEDAFNAFTGSRFSAATSSCTTALHLAVAALKLKPGDEVIVPAFTWVSTANVVEYMGAKPVFCDIDLTTFNIATDQIEALITPHGRHNSGSSVWPVRRYESNSGAGAQARTVDR